MQDKKRPKYIVKQIEEVNEFLRNTGEKDAFCSLMSFWSSYLVHNGWYRGYNFYKMKYFPEMGKSRPVLAGSSNPAEYEFIQLW